MFAVVVLFLLVFDVVFTICFLLSSNRWENRYRLNVEEYIKRRKNEERKK